MPVSPDLPFARKGHLLPSDPSIAVVDWDMIQSFNVTTCFRGNCYRDNVLNHCSVRWDRSV